MVTVQEELVSKVGCLYRALPSILTVRQLDRIPNGIHSTHVTQQKFSRQRKETAVFQKQKQEKDKQGGNPTQTFPDTENDYRTVSVWCKPE
jgi:hypothetical protein